MYHPNSKLEYHVLPKIRAGVLCTISGHVLVYFGPVRGRGPRFGPLGQFRPLEVSNRVPNLGLNYNAGCVGVTKIGVALQNGGLYSREYASN